MIAPRRAADATGWSDWGTGVVAPDGSAKLVLLLGANGQQSKADIIEFDNVRLVELK